MKVHYIQLLLQKKFHAVFLFQLIATAILQHFMTRSNRLIYVIIKVDVYDVG
jgi:hypothetical protein